MDRLGCLDRVRRLLCTESGSDATTNYVARSTASRCRMLRSRRLVIEILTKSVSECECSCHRNFPTCGCCSSCKLSSWRATYSRSICCIHLCCRAITRIAAGNSTTLPRRSRAEIVGPKIRVRYTHRSETHCRHLILDEPWFFCKDWHFRCFPRQNVAKVRRISGSCLVL